MKTIPNRRVMRTPVLLVAGQGDTDSVAGTLLRGPGTLTVEHRFNGHVVKRTVRNLQDGSNLQDGALVTAETALELANGCIACTIRDDLLILLRKLHRRADVERIVVHLSPWLEPEPICWAINYVRVSVGPGYADGPAARDVEVAAVVTCIDSSTWLGRALGDAELNDGRTVAQVVVGQAEFGDVVVLTAPELETLAVLRRLTPRARLTVGVEQLDQALAHLEPDARRGRSDEPHQPLLVGEPPLRCDGRVALVEFNAQRPFHPQRLHAAIELLLDGVFRARGRLWLSGRPEQAMWLESAGGGLRVSSAGKWLAAMTTQEAAYVNPQRRAFSNLMWDRRFGDRHSAMAVLVCGADPAEIRDALTGALLTDHEMAVPGEWNDYPDPFGEFHQDPCADSPDIAGNEAAARATPTTAEGEPPE